LIQGARKLNEPFNSLLDASTKLLRTMISIATNPRSNPTIILAIMLKFDCQIEPTHPDGGLFSS
jgi:hypothetical protein